MRAVLTVLGKDTVGILAKVSVACAEQNVNITEVTQTVLQDLFCMIMVCEVGGLTTPFGSFVDALERLGRENGLSVHVMHEDIFNAMHTV
jgi:ACT domain-containing protein